jgi:hypothetical protein
MVRKLLETPGALLLLGLLLAAGACDLNGSASGGGATPTGAPAPTATATATPSPSPSPTATPTPTPTATPTPTPKKPFFPALVSIGGSTFAQVTGAPAGSVCSVRAFLKPSGPEISGSGLKPRTVKDSATGASWDSNNGDQLLKPGTASGQKAYWQFTCANPAYDPSPRTATRDFDTP